MYHFQHLLFIGYFNSPNKNISSWNVPLSLVDFYQVFYSSRKSKCSLANPIFFNSINFHTLLKMIRMECGSHLNYLRNNVELRLSPSAGPVRAKET